MQQALPKVGIRYCNLASLGGLRHSKKDSPNFGWRNATFRGFADYMQSESFEKGLVALNERRKKDAFASCARRHCGGDAIGG
jgi:hypothetical protein